MANGNQRTVGVGAAAVELAIDVVFQKVGLEKAEVGEALESIAGLLPNGQFSLEMLAAWCLGRGHFEGATWTGDLGFHFDEEDPNAG